VVALMQHKEPRTVARITAALPMWPADMVTESSASVMECDGFVCICRMLWVDQMRSRCQVGCQDTRVSPSVVQRWSPSATAIRKTGAGGVFRTFACMVGKLLLGLCIDQMARNHPSMYQIKM
jgi:hypothetical protein